MGLKTTNYVSKRTGVIISPAYAVLRTLVIEADNTVRAKFAIQTSRGATKEYEPIDTVEVSFRWDRKSNPAKMAYETAKTEVRTIETETVKGILYGWQDDIVE